MGQGRAYERGLPSVLSACPELVTSTSPGSGREDQGWALPPLLPWRSKDRQGAKGKEQSSGTPAFLCLSECNFHVLSAQVRLWLCLLPYLERCRGAGTPSALWADSPQRSRKNCSQGLGWGSSGAWSNWGVMVPLGTGHSGEAACPLLGLASLSACLQLPFSATCRSPSPTMGVSLGWGRQ